MSAATQNEMERIARERDDMAADMDRMQRGVIATSNEIAKLKAERGDALARLYVMRVKLHEAFMMPVSVAPGSAEAEDLQDLRDLIGEAGSQFDTEAGIDRLKAEWQAEALENCENISETYFIPELGRETKVVLLDDILKVADLLRRQAEEPSHD